MFSVELCDCLVLMACPFCVARALNASAAAAGHGDILEARCRSRNKVALMTSETASDDATSHFERSTNQPF